MRDRGVFALTRTGITRAVERLCAVHAILVEYSSTKQPHQLLSTQQALLGGNISKTMIIGWLFGWLFPGPFGWIRGFRARPAACAVRQPRAPPVREERRDCPSAAGPRSPRGGAGLRGGARGLGARIGFQGEFFFFGGHYPTA